MKDISWGLIFIFIIVIILIVFVILIYFPKSDATNGKYSLYKTNKDKFFIYSGINLNIPDHINIYRLAFRQDLDLIKHGVKEYLGIINVKNSKTIYICSPTTPTNYTMVTVYKYPSLEIHKMLALNSEITLSSGEYFILIFSEDNLKNLQFSTKNIYPDVLGNSIIFYFPPNEKYNSIIDIFKQNDYNLKDTYEQKCFSLVTYPQIKITNSEIDVKEGDILVILTRNTNSTIYYNIEFDEKKITLQTDGKDYYSNSFQINKDGIFVINTVCHTDTFVSDILIFN